MPPTTGPSMSCGAAESGHRGAAPPSGFAGAVKPDCLPEAKGVSLQLELHRDAALREDAPDLRITVHQADGVTASAEPLAQHQQERQTRAADAGGAPESDPDPTPTGHPGKHTGVHELGDRRASSSVA